MESRALVAASLRRPYRVTAPMVVFVSLVPLYVFIASWNGPRTAYRPSIALDYAVPLVPSWSIVYGALYLFLIALPVFVVREQEHLQRTVRAYLAIWISAYAVFILAPTVAPRPAAVLEQSFGGWGLRLLYDADPPFNCFPSLHVAHSFVSALTAYRVHQRVGQLALVVAILVSLSTLFTKQHYVADVLGGIALALAAYLLFLRSYPRVAVPELDRRAAPVFATGLAAGIAMLVVAAWIIYKVAFA